MTSQEPGTGASNICIVIVKNDIQNIYNIHACAYMHDRQFAYQGLYNIYSM